VRPKAQGIKPLSRLPRYARGELPAKVDVVALVTEHPGKDLPQLQELCPLDEEALAKRLKQGKRDGLLRTTRGRKLVRWWPTDVSG